MRARELALRKELALTRLRIARTELELARVRRPNALATASSAVDLAGSAVELASSVMANHGGMGKWARYLRLALNVAHVALGVRRAL